MDDRINPVVLVTAVASEAGSVCVRAVASRATGGLLLADVDEAALEAAADAIERPPERVSTLAFAAADGGWARAAEFVTTHYGRLDYAVVVEPEGDLVGGLLALRAVSGLMRGNVQGGSAILAAPAQLITPRQLHQVLSVAAQEGHSSGVWVNAIAWAGDHAPAWASAPTFTGLDDEAFDAIAQLMPRTAYCDGYDLESLIPVLLAAPITGAALLADGTPTL